MTKPLPAVQALLNLASPETRRAYEKDWERYCAWLRTQRCTPARARPRHVEAYVSHLRSQKKARTTIGRALSSIREVYAALVRRELIETNPAREIKNPKQSATPRTPWLNESQVRRLLDMPSTTWQERRDRLCLRLLFGLGWRRSEVARMRFEDVKGGKVRGVLKGGKVEVVGVPAWLQDEIAAWCKFARITKGPLLPRAPDKPRAIDPRTVYAIVRAAAVRAGLPLDLCSPHALRRSYITIGGERGVSLKMRQLAVGHTSQSTTERYDRARDAAANAPGQVFADLVGKR